SFFFQAEDGIRDFHVTGVQTCALPIWILVADLRDQQGHEQVRDAAVARHRVAGVAAARAGQQRVVDRGHAPSPIFSTACCMPLRRASTSTLVEYAREAASMSAISSTGLTLE